MINIQSKKRSAKWLIGVNTPKCKTQVTMSRAVCGIYVSRAFPNHKQVESLQRGKIDL